MSSFVSNVYFPWAQMWFFFCMRNKNSTNNFFWWKRNSMKIVQRLNCSWQSFKHTQQNIGSKFVANSFESSHFIRNYGRETIIKRWLDIARPFDCNYWHWSTIKSANSLTFQRSGLECANAHIQRDNEQTGTFMLSKWHFSLNVATNLLLCRAYSVSRSV